LAALAAFDEFSRRPEFSYRSHRAEHNRIERRIQKEIFAFSELAHSLQDHCRLVRSRWDTPLIASRIPVCFGEDGLHDFVLGLRRALHHLSMVDANWEIRGSGRGATSHYHFNNSELREANPDWNINAQRYLANADERMDISEFASNYHRRVHNFYDPLLDEGEKNPPEAVADYRRCWNAHRQRSTRTTWNFVLSHYRGGTDPYRYLDRFLTPEQLEAAQRFPHRSPAQVDFIILAVDEFSACDEALRQKIYQIFGVPSNLETDGSAHQKEPHGLA
jgi:hypothetical protein